MKQCLITKKGMCLTVNNLLQSLNNDNMYSGCLMANNSHGKHGMDKPVSQSDIKAKTRNQWQAREVIWVKSRLVY